MADGLDNQGDFCFTEVQDQHGQDTVSPNFKNKMKENKIIKLNTTSDH